MNHSIKELKAVFTNGNELSLALSECHFAGFKPANVWQLSYGERYEGSYGDNLGDIPKEDEHYFMSCNMEYFPETSSDLAIASFAERSTSVNPGCSTINGLRLEDFLEKESLESSIMNNELSPTLSEFDAGSFDDSLNATASLIADSGMTLEEHQDNLAKNQITPVNPESMRD